MREPDNTLSIPYTRLWRFLSTFDKLLSLYARGPARPHPRSSSSRVSRGGGGTHGTSRARALFPPPRATPRVAPRPGLLGAHLNINLLLHCPLLLLAYLTGFYFYRFLATSRALSPRVDLPSPYTPDARALRRSPGPSRFKPARESLIADTLRLYALYMIFEFANSYGFIGELSQGMFI